MAADIEKIKIMTKLPNPINVLWNVLLDKGIVTKEELYAKSLEMSGLSEKEFNRQLKKLEE